MVNKVPNGTLMIKQELGAIGSDAVESAIKQIWRRVQLSGAQLINAL